MATQVKVPMIHLNDGHEIPAVAFGSYQGTYDNKDNYNKVVDIMKSAIDAGYRHIDTATVYDTEKAIGQAIEEKTEEGAIKRSDIYLTTKLWSNCHRKEYVVPSLQKSLEDLKMDYVDLYLVHWPVAVKPSSQAVTQDQDGNTLFDDQADIITTWKCMEECKNLGLAKSIGVSNFNPRQLEKLLAKCTIPPAVNQVECHVHNNCESLAKYCKEKNIVVSCYSPLGNPGRYWKKDGDPDIFTDETLTSIATARGKTNAQVALRYLLQRGLVVIPKSSNTLRQRQNFEILDFCLSDGEMATIGTCNRDHRVLWYPAFKGSKEYPFA